MLAFSSSMSPRRALITRTVAALTGAAIAVLGLAPVTFAHADTSPAAGSNLPTTVTDDYLPTVQIAKTSGTPGGVVWAQVTVGNTVYATGDFNFGVDPGSSTYVPHGGLLAFDIRTGVMTSFTHNLNGAGKAITVSPDGNTLYVGGDFTMVDGLARGHLAAFDVASGTLKSTFAPAISGGVGALTATNTTVYAGGAFDTVNGSTASKNYVSLQASNGLATPGFTGSTAYTASSNVPSAATVTAITLSGDGSTLLVAGRYTTLNGTARPGIGGVNATNGAIQPWNSSWPIRDNNSQASLTQLKTFNGNIYGSAYTTNFQGNFEGTFEIDKTGNFIWLDSCHGDTYDIVALNGALYSASHAHDCSDIGAWEETTPRIWHRANATTDSATPGCVLAKNNDNAYTNYAGYPCATLLTWDPNFAAGTFTGATQGPWSTSGNSQYLAMGGEFPTVDGIAQYGLARFAMPDQAPKKVGPLNSTTLLPNVLTPAPGTARISWRATWDRDNENLTYTLYRGTSNSTPIYTVTTASRFWNLPTMGYTDTGQSTTTGVRYHLTITDPDGNVRQPGSSPALVLNGSGTSTNPYYSDVLADGADNYWRLDEASGPAVVNSASYNDAVAFTTVTRGAAGALIGDSDTAATFDGAAAGTGFVSSENRTNTPGTYSSELWFKSTSTKGGVLMSYGSADTGTSAHNYDRAVYLGDNGKVNFGVNNTNLILDTPPSSNPAATPATLTSSAAYNNGQWHQVVATLSSAGMSLYVDGKLVGHNTVTTGMNFAGYWRIGGDNLPGWKNTPTNPWFAGSIDEVATYPTALTLAQVQAHFNDSGRTVAVAPSPTASFTATTNFQQVTVDGSASSDPSSEALTYAWNYGDGSTATGVKPATHLYASAGTYTVTLTVTNTDGASGTATKSVTVVANQAPTASFTSVVTGGSVAFDGTGSSDTDGTVASYSWNFGDGSTGSGPKPTHSYAAAGTYTVTLTVTDNGGGTGSTSNTVTTTVAGITTIAADGFARTTATGWGTADTGGAWTVSSTSITSVNGSAGVVKQPAGTTVTAYLNSVSSSDTDLRVTAALDKVPTGGGTYLTLSGRKVTGQGEYRAKVQLVAGGAVKIQLIRSNSSGTETAIGSAVTVSGLTYTAGTVLGLRFQATGTSPTTLQAKVWNNASAEPSAWQVSATDTTAGLQTAGALGLLTYASGSTTNAPQTISIDDLSATSANSTPPPTNQAPVAAFTATPTGLTAALDASASTDDTAVTGYAWNFGDSTTGTGKTTSHTYTDAGTYTVTLTVTDGAGLTGTTAHSVTVAPAPNQAPVAKFTTAQNNLTVTVNGTSSTDADGTVAGYAWDFGDNGTDTGATPAAHTYASAGTYTITLTVTDNDGATGTTTSSVTVAQNQSPAAAFTSTINGATVAFDASTSADPDGTISSYAWDFGDNASGTGKTPSHTYSQSGTYTVTLVVTDNQSATATTSNQVSVTVPASTAVAADAFARTTASGWGSADTGGAWTVSAASAFAVNGSAGVMTLATAGASRNAYLNSVSSSDTDAQLTFSLNKVPTGGGTYITLAGRKVAGQGEYRAKVQILATGAVKINLVRSNSAGTETAIGSAVTVAGLTYTAGTVLRFRFQVTGTTSTSLNAKVWDNAVAEPASFQVTGTDSTAGLQAAGGIGVIGYASGSTTNAPQTISFDSLRATTTGPVTPNQNPVAAFAAVVNGASVAFDASASADPDGTISSYAWDFGDSSSGTGAGPSHSYTTAGDHTVTLTVTDNSGGTNSVSKTVTTTTAGAADFAADNFTRNATNSWGAADTGGAWAVSTASAFAVTGSAGTMTLAAAGNSRNAYLNSVSSKSTDLRLTLALNKLPTGGGTYVTLAGRKVAGQGEYRAKIQITSAGAVTLSLIRSNSGGTETVLVSASTIAGLTYTAGMVLGFRLQVSGTGTTTLKAKVWNNAGAEPAAFQKTGTDTTAGLQAAGAIGVIGYASGSTTNAPQIITFDALHATAVAGV